jgi:hypothetical protein
MDDICDTHKPHNSSAGGRRDWGDGVPRTTGRSVEASAARS